MAGVQEVAELLPDSLFSRCASNAITAPWRNGRRRGFKSAIGEDTTGATAENVPLRAEDDGTNGMTAHLESEVGHVVDVVEETLAAAMAVAVTAGDLTRADLFCRELTARREARASVVALDVERARRKR